MYTQSCSNRLTIRLGDDLWQYVIQAASLAQMRPSEYVRQVLEQSKRGFDAALAAKRL